jgi:hypothetical protein
MQSYGMLGEPYVVVGINEWLRYGTLVTSPIAALFEGSLGLMTNADPSDPFFQQFRSRWNALYQQNASLAANLPEPLVLSAYVFDGIDLLPLSLLFFKLIHIDQLMDYE